MGAKWTGIMMALAAALSALGRPDFAPARDDAGIPLTAAAVAGGIPSGRSGGLAAFGMALTVADAAVRAEALLQALSADPSSEVIADTLRREALQEHVTLTPAQHESLLELALAHPEYPALGSAVLSVGRLELPDDAEENDGRGRKRLRLAGELSRKLFESGRDERQLLNALLNYGILSCALGRIGEAEVFWAGLEEAFDGGDRGREAVVAEAAAMFFADAGRWASPRRRWLGLAESDRARLQRQRDHWLKRLESYGDLSLEPGDRERRRSVLAQLGAAEQASRGEFVNGGESL